MSTQKQADLRCCASCEWIFKRSEEGGVGCPQCQFGSYGARWVHGNKAYRYYHTQERWHTRKMDTESWRLAQIIRKARPNKSKWAQWI